MWPSLSLRRRHVDLGYCNFDDADDQIDENCKY